MMFWTCCSNYVENLLGSTSGTVDANGSPVSTLLYTAFGETRLANGATNTDYRYTGQREDQSINLMWYGSRWYDPYLSRWTSPDSIVPDPYNVQDWDRYAYVRNNPIKYNDPTGHDVGCPGYDASHCATNSPIRRLIQHSTPLYRTPIIPKGPSQEHGSSLRAAPTNTPTPQTVIGPGPSKTPLPSSTIDESPEQKISVDWDKVDYVDLTIDALGIIGDASLVIVPGPSVIIDGIVTVVELGGAIKTGVEIYNKDYSGVSALSVDIA